MKKLLIATTALVATAGVAAADVKLSGYGRFGLDYNGSAAAGTSKTQVNMRMRVNIDASTATDSGVTFGGRIRLQYTDGDGIANTTVGTAIGGQSELNAAMLYATYGGMRMEVGNANTAIDSAKLMYNSEIGYLNRSMGNPIGNFLAYNTGAYAAGEEDRMGVFASYAFGDGNVRLSYINPDQTLSSLPVGTDAEVSISADYTFGQFTVSGAYADNAGFADNEKNLFLGAEYALNADTNVGLLWFRQDVDAIGDRDRFTLYGNYTQGAITYRGYVAHDDNYGVDMQTGVNAGVGRTKTTFGLGLDYDLGGARLGLDVHRNYTKDTVAGVGVRFDF